MKKTTGGKKAIVYIQAFSELDQRRTYQIDGKDYMVATNKNVVVPLELAEVIKDAGHCEDYTIVE